MRKVYLTNCTAVKKDAKGRITETVTGELITNTMDVLELNKDDFYLNRFFRNKGGKSEGFMFSKCGLIQEVKGL